MNRATRKETTSQFLWHPSITGADVLTRYRLKRLIEETGGTIDVMLYELMLKVLDHIEVGDDGRVDVIFLIGTRIETDVR